jgi:hypothetical protein
MKLNIIKYCIIEYNIIQKIKEHRIEQNII